MQINCFHEQDQREGASHPPHHTGAGKDWILSTSFFLIVFSMKYKKRNTVIARFIKPQYFPYLLQTLRNKQESREGSSASKRGEKEAELSFLQEFNIRPSFPKDCIAPCPQG